MSLVVINPSAEFQVQSTTPVTIAPQPSKLEALEQQFIDLCNQNNLVFSEAPIVNEIFTKRTLNETELNIAELERESGIDAEFYNMFNELQHPELTEDDWNSLNIVHNVNPTLWDL